MACYIFYVLTWSGAVAFCRKSDSAMMGKIRTERGPAAMRAAPVALVIKSRSMPICEAATINDNEVACSSLNLREGFLAFQCKIIALAVAGKS